tara:strand:- start:5016 stop:5612 length:597 start_codon:yes stop_codon:yes gene_type:complete
MALTDKKYETIHDKTGNDKNKIKEVHDDKSLDVIASFPENSDPFITSLVHQISLMQEELDYLRTEISANKDKTGISTSQASAITANTAKTGITTQQATDITDNKNEAKRLDGLVTTNATNITVNARSIGINNAAAINVGAYPSNTFMPAGTTQSHGSEIVYDTKQKKYFLNIYYIEDTPAKGGKKGQRIIRAGQIELK